MFWSITEPAPVYASMGTPGFTNYARLETYCFTRYLNPRGAMGCLKDIKMTNIDELINYAKKFSGLTPELESRSKAIAPEMAPHLKVVKNSLNALYESCQRLN